MSGVLDDYAYNQDSGYTRNDVILSDPTTTTYGTPASYNPDANSFVDLLKYGIGHYASYQTAALNKPTQAAPVYTNANQPTAAQQAVNAQLMRWALIGGAVFLGITLLSKAKA